MSVTEGGGLTVYPQGGVLGSSEFAWPCGQIMVLWVCLSQGCVGGFWRPCGFVEVMVLALWVHGSSWQFSFLFRSGSRLVAHGSEWVLLRSCL